MSVQHHFFYNHSLGVVYFFSSNYYSLLPCFVICSVWCIFCGSCYLSVCFIQTRRSFWIDSIQIKSVNITRRVVLNSSSQNLQTHSFNGIVCFRQAYFIYVSHDRSTMWRIKSAKATIHCPYIGIALRVTLYSFAIARACVCVCVTVAYQVRCMNVCLFELWICQLECSLCATLFFIYFFFLLDAAANEYVSINQWK